MPTTGSLTSGIKTLGSRTFTVSVPPVDLRAYPVLIVLHGNGGNGRGEIERYQRDAQLSSKYVLVAPDGSKNSWNVVNEESKLDDVGFVGKTLLDHLATFSNVKPVFTIAGNSNGAALVNRILIENDDARIMTAVTTVSQLNGKQYRDGKFYIGGSDNVYTTVKQKLTKRRLLQITGAEDTLIPATAKMAGIPGLGVMVSWDDSAFVYARAYGFSGAKASVRDSADKQSVSYAGLVDASNFKQGGHGTGGKQGWPTVLAFLRSSAPPAATPLV